MQTRHFTGLQGICCLAIWLEQLHLFDDHLARSRLCAFVARSRGTDLNGVTLSVRQQGVVVVHHVFRVALHDFAALAE